MDGLAELTRSQGRGPGVGEGRPKHLGSVVWNSHAPRLLGWSQPERKLTHSLGAASSTETPPDALRGREEWDLPSGPSHL